MPEDWSHEKILEEGMLEECVSKMIMSLGYWVKEI